MEQLMSFQKICHTSSYVQPVGVPVDLRLHQCLIDILPLCCICVRLCLKLNSDVKLFYFEHWVLCNAIFVICMCSVDILGTHTEAFRFCENLGVTLVHE
jgi:hypothetical protein